MHLFYTLTFIVMIMMIMMAMMVMMMVRGAEWQGRQMSLWFKMLDV